MQVAAAMLGAIAQAREDLTLEDLGRPLKATLEAGIWIVRFDPHYPCLWWDGASKDGAINRARREISRLRQEVAV